MLGRWPLTRLYIPFSTVVNSRRTGEDTLCVFSVPPGPATLNRLKHNELEKPWGTGWPNLRMNA